MKLRSLFLTLLVMLTGVVMAQVEQGKVYRIVSSKYGTVITTNLTKGELVCVEKGADANFQPADYLQMWEFVKDEETGKWSIQNLFSRRYVQNERTKEVTFKTAKDPVLFAITENAANAGHYNIDANNDNNGWGLHCNSSSRVVPWSYAKAGEAVSGSEWTFEEVSLTETQRAEANATGEAYYAVQDNAVAIIEKVNAMFEDNAGTQLKAEYAGMSDDELRDYLQGAPADLQDAIIKVKNDSWAKCEERPLLGEKNFRVHNYKPYSSPEEWKDILYHRPFNRINNPTGICSESELGYIYVWVDAIPDGTYVHLSEMVATGYWGTDTELKVGLNIVPSANKDGVLYIRYICDTHTGFDMDTKSGPKKLEDFPDVKVHIEGGYVNGFWSKERGHTNEDWVYLGEHMLRNKNAVQAVGDHTVLNFYKEWFLCPYDKYNEKGEFMGKACPKDIETVIKYWDFWNKTQRKYMALDNYYEYFNNKQLAMSDDNGYMDAGNYRTHYHNNTLSTIVNVDRLVNDGGSSWGPLHEIGHTNQYVFEIVGTSEVSNNALANFTLFDQGTHTSRGLTLEPQIKDFENKVPFVQRGEGHYGHELFSMTRMYFQLFLYFHAAEKNTNFYPALFEELRRDRLNGFGITSSGAMDENGFHLNSVNAVQDQLKFVEKCCSIAQMDLTEFFEAWGFFMPMKNAYVGDYGYHFVYLLQKDIDDCKARIKAANYPKKGGHLMFLEDRVRYSPMKKSEVNTNTGNRIRFSDEECNWIGETCGLFGQWNDYVDETVKAEGYYYNISNGIVTILRDDNAKGALGFKLYDADTDELITYTNKLSMTIPQSCKAKNFKVVAAQANGEDAVLEIYSKDSASMASEVLKKTVALAKKYVARKWDESAKIAVGQFLPEDLVQLESLLADTVILNNSATTAQQIAELNDAIAAECVRIKDYFQHFEEGVKYVLKSKIAGNLVNTPNGVGVITNNKRDDSYYWHFEYAGDKDVYYLRSDAGGYYLGNFTSHENEEQRVRAEEPETTNAVPLRILYDNDGYATLTKECAEENGLSLYVYNDWDGDNNRYKEELKYDGKTGFYVKARYNDNRGLWTAYVQEDNSAETYKQLLEEAMQQARVVLTEVLDADGKIRSSLMVLDDKLEQYVVELNNHYKAVEPTLKEATKRENKSNLITLRELLNKVAGKYIVTAPVAVNGETIAWYRLKDIDGNGYLGVSNKNTSRNKDRLAFVDEDDLEGNREMWAFASTGNPNEYKVYNREFNLFISQRDKKSDLNVTDGFVTLTANFNAENNTISFMVGEEYVVASGAFVGLDSGTPASWVLELVEIEKNSELSGAITSVECVVEEAYRNAEIYDLSGRRVENPTQGIYIQNGKKVYIK